MISQHTFKDVLSGRKTQTRRIIKPGQRLLTWNEDYDKGALIDAPLQPNDRVFYRTGKTYAVQPGRGQKAVGRIKIVSIRREDVRLISDADVIAEGFEWRSEFLKTWAGMHDKSFYEMVHRYEDRPADRYQAWVLEFKLVEVYPAYQKAS